MFLFILCSYKFIEKLINKGYSVIDVILKKPTNFENNNNNCNEYLSVPKVYDKTTPILY